MQTSVHSQHNTATHYVWSLEQTWSHLLSVNLEDLELHQLWQHGIRESLKSRVNQVGFLIPLVVIMTEITC